MTNRLLSGTRPIPGNTGEFVWSPDSRHIAFRSNINADNSSELFVANVDGTVVQVSDTTPMGRFDVADFMQWSPDGMYVSFAVQTDAGRRYYAVQRSGANLVDLTAGVDASPRVLDTPKWRGDSRRLAYVAVDGAGGRHLYTVDPDGSNQWWFMQRVREHGDRGGLRRTGRDRPHAPDGHIVAAIAGRPRLAHSLLLHACRSGNED